MRNTLRQVLFGERASHIFEKSPEKMDEFRPLLAMLKSASEKNTKVSNEIALNLLQALNQRHGKTIVMVTHDPHAAARASHTLHLTKGQLTREPEAA